MSSAELDHVDRMMQAWRRTAPEIDVSDLAVAGRLLRCAALLQQEIERALKPLGLTFADFDVINTVRRDGGRAGVHPRRLTAESLITTGAMATRLARLEGSGLLVRVPDPDDGRAVRVRLTSLGSRRAGQALEAVLAADRAFLEALDPDTASQVAAGLRSLLLAHDRG